MRRVIFNKKGGVGKSTIACNLAAISAMKGRRTLLIDLDPQCNSSQYLLGVETAATIRPHLADFFEQTLNFSFYHNKPITAFIHDTPFARLHLLPSATSLDSLHSKLESRYKLFKLREALNQLDSQFDAIYLDTPPALNFFTLSALVAADSCLIPFDCDDFSRQALYALYDSVAEIQRDHNDKLKIEGIVVNQFQSNARLPKQLVQELIDEGLPVFKTRLEHSVKVRESHQASTPLIYHDRSHKITQRFLELYGELEKEN
ncbi:ParA family protein [Thioflexithrix psekupsensis]|uniref:Cobyric acid synthase n=1 Tax=Thioflexithrix psekupsensis TaxID=1570016 RepID=A0A251X421_9GAMM|nr:ParA family protein [Thioflexithrix psekupsensis]OUD12201.1 cobyric acid synthase [Thioflexithrix psekupsensis]